MNQYRLKSGLTKTMLLFRGVLLSALFASVPARSTDTNSEAHIAKIIACDGKDEHYVAQAYDSFLTFASGGEVKSGELSFPARLVEKRGKFIAIERAYYIARNELRGFELFIPNDLVYEKNGVFTSLVMLSAAQRETRQGITSITLQETTTSNTDRTNWPTSSKTTFFRISDWNSVEAELGKSFEDDVENPFKRSKLFKKIKSGHDQQMFIEMTMQSDHLTVPLAGFLCLKEQSHEEAAVKTAMCIILESKHPASPVNAPIFEFLRTRKDMALSNAFTDLATRAGTNVNLTILLSVLSNDWLYDWFHNSQTTLCCTAEATVLDELIGRSQKHNQKLSPKMIAELNKMQFVPGFPRAIFVLYSDADKPVLMTNLKSVLEDKSINDATMLALIARKRDLIEELLSNDRRYRNKLALVLNNSLTRLRSIEFGTPIVGIHVGQTTS